MPGGLDNYATALLAGKTLKYDAAGMRVTNDSKANEYLSGAYREGWHINDM